MLVLKFGGTSVGTAEKYRKGNSDRQRKIEGR